MPVEIVQDTTKLLDVAAFDRLVVGIADYIPAVQHIKQAVQRSETARILVHHPVCATWLQRLAASYSESEVRFTVISARDELARRWQTAIPDSVSDADVLASGFLEADVIPRSGQSYELSLIHISEPTRPY